MQTKGERGRDSGRKRQRERAKVSERDRERNERELEREDGEGEREREGRESPRAITGEIRRERLRERGREED